MRIKIILRIAKLLGFSWMTMESRIYGKIVILGRSRQQITTILRINEERPC